MSCAIEPPPVSLPVPAKRESKQTSAFVELDGGANRACAAVPFGHNNNNKYV